MSYGLLIDTTKCIGCRGCQVACKQSHDLPADRTGFRPIRTNPPDLTAHTWSLIEFYEVPKSSQRLAWRFVKRQCMHCLEPACVSVCPVAALRKTAEGPVIYDAKRCIGCRYCMNACPFNVPKYEWDSATPLISKCIMCTERLVEGEQPACAKACLTGAIKFGQRDALLAEAHSRIAAQPKYYVNYVYGEHEVGGTGVLYLSDVPFAAIGFPASLPLYPLPAKTWAVMSLVPGIAGGAAALMSFAYLITKRQHGLNQKRVAATTSVSVPVEADDPPADPPAEEVQG